MVLRGPLLRLILQIEMQKVAKIGTLWFYIFRFILRLIFRLTQCLDSNARKEIKIQLHIKIQHHYLRSLPASITLNETSILLSYINAITFIINIFLSIVINILKDAPQIGQMKRMVSLNKLLKTIERSLVRLGNLLQKRFQIELGSSVKKDGTQFQSQRDSLMWINFSSLIYSLNSSTT